MSQALNKVIAERRKKRKQKAETKRVERRERLIKEQQQLLEAQEAKRKQIEEAKQKVTERAEEASFVERQEPIKESPGEQESANKPEPEEVP